MESINSFFNKLFSPFYSYTHFLLRITLGISFSFMGLENLKLLMDLPAFSVLKEFYIQNL